MGRPVRVEVTGLAHLFDLADGRELDVFPYNESDSRGICAPPENESIVYLGNAWSTGTIIDVATGKSRQGRGPKSCAYDAPRRLRDTGDVEKRRYVNAGAAPPPGFDWMAVAAGDDRDAVGIATPKGDVGVVMVGIDAKTKATRWQLGATNLFGRTVERAAMIELADGAAYVGLGPDIAALDARTGALRWIATPMVGMIFNVTLTSERLYVVSGEWPGLPVEVFDVSTGKRIARVGRGRED